jgi:cystathionine beta-lyase/cystathionine gamma-synthase
MRLNETAGALAAWLEDAGLCERVYYPGLASHPDHSVAKSQMSGFGGLICVDVETQERAEATFDRLRVWKRAVSLGGVESLCSLPVLTSHYGLSDEELRAAGVGRG